MSKRKSERDVDGNAMASAVAVQREMVRTAEKLYRMEELLDKLFEEDQEVLRIAVQCPDGDRDDYMVYVTGLVDGKRCVAFHGGATFREALIGAIDRMSNRSLKWREDKYKT